MNWKVLCLSLSKSVLYPVNDCVTPNTNTIIKRDYYIRVQGRGGESTLQTNPIMFLKSTARLHNKLSQCLQTLPRSQPNVKLWPESEKCKVNVFSKHVSFDLTFHIHLTQDLRFTKTSTQNFGYYIAQRNETWSWSYLKVRNVLML